LRRNNRIYCVESLELLTDLACLTTILRVPRQSWEILHNQAETMTWLTKIPILNNTFNIFTPCNSICGYGAAPWQEVKLTLQFGCKVP